MGEATITTAALVRRWASAAPDQCALRDGARSVTFAELDADTSRVASALAADGVRPGDRIAYLDRNGIDQVELMLGAAKLGAVPTPINFRLAPPEVRYIVADSGAALVGVGDGFETLAPDVPGARVMRFGEEFARWRDAAPADDPHGDGPDAVALQLYSSGTTGRPKGVLLTHANLAGGLAIYPELIELDRSAVSLVPMPLFHIGGTGWLLAGMAVGATSVLVRDPDPALLVELIEREGVTHSFIVPALLQAMLAVPGIEQRDLSSLSHLLYGASPITEHTLAQAIRTFGCRFVQVYGLTESTGTVVILPAADHDPDGPHRHRLRAIGLPAPGAEVRVVDPRTGEDTEGGAVGEIWIRGPMVMRGYWHLPDATAAAVSDDGWLRSGDAAYRDADGYLYVYDRVKDMIVSGGENVYPAEVESALSTHPAVADVAVIGVPDERWGERPVALVVRRSGVEVSPEELIAHCRERLAGFKCPSRVEWRDQLPRNPSGKILKRQLREPYWEGRERYVG